MEGLKSSAGRERGAGGGGGGVNGSGTQSRKALKLRRFTSVQLQRAEGGAPVREGNTFYSLMKLFDPVLAFTF